jgi:hypothetical protein
MAEVLTAVIGKIDPAIFQVLVVVAAAAVIYYLPKIRRDKNGKLYIFQRGYEKAKTREKATQTLLDEIRRWVKRLELLEAIHHTPEAAQVIHQIYGEYKGIQGNSYLDEVYQAWNDEYGHKVIKGRIKKGENHGN